MTIRALSITSCLFLLALKLNSRWIMGFAGRGEFDTTVGLGGEYHRFADPAVLGVLGAPAEGGQLWINQRAFQMPTEDVFLEKAAEQLKIAARALLFLQPFIHHIISHFLKTAIR